MITCKTEEKIQIIKLLVIQEIQQQESNSNLLSAGISLNSKPGILHWKLPNQRPKESGLKIKKPKEAYNIYYTIIISSGVCN